MTERRALVYKLLFTNKIVTRFEYNYSYDMNNINTIVT
jgi:hypothetical protein